MLDQHSVLWRYAGDARVVPLLGKAFLLQAAHPTIGAGVADYSNFKEDPVGRLQQTYGLVLNTLYAADGERVGAGVREYHKRIKGTKPDGTRYHAYEPEAYFWVLATGYDAIVTAAERFLQPMTAAEKRLAYEEMRELGRRFGLRDRDMPESLEAFDEWYAWVLAERIENNQTVRDVIETAVRRPNPPSGFPGALWAIPRPIAAHAIWLTTMGTLTQQVRDRLEIPWSRIDDAQLSVIARAFRALNPAPARWFYLPPAREAFARTSTTAVSAARNEPIAA